MREASLSDWLSFPYAGVKMEAVTSLKMSDCSVTSEKNATKGEGDR